ncbi:MAG: 2-keto-3-deoxy-D-arabino-heptulosonate-7-phosphate synthase I beta [uncultured Thermomicrobiales bacterium]|uniref:2-keto-3-deoxy-D-arabino-heptulosonate-7-phosphat e synthase I beta n=1 Tax=uncultured Thermomicrobiales bacterium TaxID=1645740 RepID=A0A6J4V331_9BACT|nr:MAG: 2-keto-3-deoxy-D-arabino-heptulosonate-7-phosphate synthase I beta [uncultured Thermomicrobiales bacterium]
MIVTIAADAPAATGTAIFAAAAAAGIGARGTADGRGGTLVGLDAPLPPDALMLPGVDAVHREHKPYMLASREHRGPSVVRVGDVAIGGPRPVLMAGPCVVEGKEELLAAAEAVRAAGADMLRGGAYKPRTSPYAFQGLGEEGLRHLAAARAATGLPVVTEVLEPDQVELVAEYADMLQIGSRNMANFPLLRRVGRSGRPVLLKRGFSATVEEWLMSAEYILASGNPDVVLCERGLRGFDPLVRFNLDLNAVPLAKELSHLPVVVDPSHGTGKRTLVGRMALAGLAAGADGLIIEVHPTPETARCDASQTISPAELASIRRRGLALHAALTEESDDVVLTGTGAGELARSA